MGVHGKPLPLEKTEQRCEYNRHTAQSRARRRRSRSEVALPRTCMRVILHSSDPRMPHRVSSTTQRLEGLLPLHEGNPAAPGFVRTDTRAMQLLRTPADISGQPGFIGYSTGEGEWWGLISAAPFAHYLASSLSPLSVLCLLRHARSCQLGGAPRGPLARLHHPRAGR